MRFFDELLVQYQRHARINDCQRFMASQFAARMESPTTKRILFDSRQAGRTDKIENRGRFCPYTIGWHGDGVGQNGLVVHYLDALDEVADNLYTVGVVGVPGHPVAFVKAFLVLQSPWLRWPAFIGWLAVPLDAIAGQGSLPAGSAVTIPIL